MTNKITPQPIYFPEEPKIISVQPPKSDLNIKIDSILSGLSSSHLASDKEFAYLSEPVPNIIEWVTGVENWNVPSTFQFWGQYQILRDFFNLRCRICNSQHPDRVSCWNKSRSYLESEVLLVWSKEYQDFVCPKCGTTMREFLDDKIIIAYNELVAVIGMRGGKSYLGAHIGGYLEHLMVTWGIEKPGTLQQKLGQEKSEWFEVNFVASTEKQAKKTIYSKFRQMRRNSPWMNRYMNWVKIKEKVQIGVKDPWRYGVSTEEIEDGYLQLRLNKLPSDSSGIAGATRFATLLDEWARFIDTEGSRSGTEIYRVLNAGLKTIRSAAMLDPSIPYFFGTMVAITSSMAIDDPAMQTIEKANSGKLKKTFAIKKTTWDFNPFQPRSAFDEEYERDPVAADRDFGSNPPAAITPFISDPARFWKSINWDKRPIATFVNTYPKDKTGREYVGLDLERCALDTVNNYYIFGDAGKSFDTFSLAGGHPVWLPIDSVQDAVEETSGDSSGRILPPAPDGVMWPEELGTVMRPDRGGDFDYISKMNNERLRLSQHGVSTPASGPSYDHKGEVLCTEVDFCVRIIPEVDKNVWFDSIIKIIEKLSKQIKINTVCFDRWNSISTIQQIRNMQIQSHEVTLKITDFLRFRDMLYNGRIIMLPPNEDDMVNVNEDGRLIIGSAQETMTAHGVVLVELMKLSRSKDLKQIFNINKGKIRGKDSDDVARCVMGLHHIIQDSVVDHLSGTKKRKELKKMLTATESSMSGSIYKGKGQ